MWDRVRHTMIVAIWTSLATMLVSAGVMAPAEAQYFRRPVSEVNPTIMQIDEKSVLGKKVDGETPLIAYNGNEFRWKDMLGKPLILVLSYYTCDGACSIINSQLRDHLADITRVRAGNDFRILTLSFDNHDNLESAGAFRQHLDLTRELSDNWMFATFKNEADLKAQTSNIGFKFFWSPEDRVFLHPGAFLFFSAEGRLIRVLYQDGIGARDIELAVLDAKEGQFRPQEIVNLAIGLCYSYNYKDGKYTLNLPMFIGIGSAFIGVVLLLLSITVFKLRRQGNTKKGAAHAQMV
jgi:protein SCO1/2